MSFLLLPGKLTWQLTIEKQPFEDVSPIKKMLIFQPVMWVNSGVAGLQPLVRHVDFCCKALGLFSSTMWCPTLISFNTMISAFEMLGDPLFEGWSCGPKRWWSQDFLGKRCLRSINFQGRLAVNFREGNEKMMVCFAHGVFLCETLGGTWAFFRW